MSWNCSSENPGRYRGSSEDVLHLLTASSHKISNLESLKPSKLKTK